MFFADPVGGLSFGGFSKFGQTASKVIGCFVPHAGAKSLGFGLAFNGAAFVATLVISVGVSNARGILLIAGRDGVVVIRSLGRCSSTEHNDGGEGGKKLILG